MNIVEATRDYETWLAAARRGLHGPELDHKHAAMSAKGDLLPFFRWPLPVGAALARMGRAVEQRAAKCSPSATSIWGTSARGAIPMGVCVWGVNDFDEADDLPYTHDLTWLVASVWAAKPAFDLPLSQARIAQGGASRLPASSWRADPIRSCSKSVALRSCASPCRPNAIPSIFGSAWKSAGSLAGETAT
jgi:hypothetical protein